LTLPNLFCYCHTLGPARQEAHGEAASAGENDREAHAASYADRNQEETFPKEGLCKEAGRKAGGEKSRPEKAGEVRHHPFRSRRVRCAGGAGDA
jgi:hypothetical protein